MLKYLKPSSSLYKCWPPLIVARHSLLYTIYIDTDRKHAARKYSEKLSDLSRNKLCYDIVITMWPSNQALMGIAGVFGGVVGCTGLYMHSNLQKQFKQTIFARESLCKLRENEPAKYLLGKNIFTSPLVLMPSSHPHRNSYKGLQYSFPRHGEQL